MPTPRDESPAADSRRETPRAQLARIASAVAGTHPGVTGLDAGPAGVQATFLGTERLPGVAVVADGDRHTVDLFLTAEPTDLIRLAGDVLDAVRAAAISAGLGDALGAIHVTFTDLTLPEETTSP